MKNLVLLLFSVFVVMAVNVVSAEEYMVKIDGLSDSDIQYVLNSTSWKYYTPQYSLGNVITFPTEDDFARFLLPYDGSNFAFSPDLYSVSKQATVFKVSATLVGNDDVYKTIELNLSGPGYVYILSDLQLDLSAYDWASHCWIYDGDTLLLQDKSGFYKKLVTSGKLKVVMKDHGAAQASKFNIAIVFIDNNFTITRTDGLNCMKIDFKVIPQPILEIYSQPNANIYIDNELKGKTDNGGYFKTQVIGGEHELKISKDGFWDYTTTINIQNDTEIHVNLVPKNAIFGVTYKLEDNAYPDSIAKLSLKLSPIEDAYGTRMRISGVDVIKVLYNGQELEKSDDGSYILGDISKEVELEIQFKTPSSWGEHSFTIGLEASDVEGNLYSQQETITYEVLELPFLLELPEWKIGDNTVRVTDTTGQSYAVLLVLHDKDGNEVWSESKTLLEYGSAEFNVKIPSAGDYVLEIQGNGAKTYKEIHIVEPITLITKEVKAGKGQVATVKFSIVNPSSKVKYYYATLESGLLNLSINKTFAVSPNENKTVEISFEVPKNAIFDSYQLILKVYDSETDGLLFEGNVVLKIVENTIPIAIGDSSIPLWLIAIVGVLLVGGIAYALIRK
ncbi:PEGA domain-containing protein [Methanocaldococcus fervens]|uniref:PEGA domain protein n=1 Tax=Methanocaldococcus fervens (strain DSM 4213 / JCM 15782 / AG86) TaxID=573064 RepID=C7P9P2_METFA|nr:PEGA domain-containing protein [Methanocaldococcus fervens]ACV25399.1 PEGA domain protein [Methanocaldococcus fervens AG86]